MNIPSKKESCLMGANLVWPNNQTAIQNVHDRDFLFNRLNKAMMPS